MSKGAKGTKQVRVTPEEIPAESRKKSRKSSEQEKQNSPLAVKAPSPAEKTSPASQQESEDSGALDLPDKSSKPKKVLNFRNHFPPGARSCLPGCDYSEDDDEDSKQIKDQKVELVMQRNATYYEQMSGDEDNPGEDSPFWSNLIWPNCQLLNFGLAREMHPNFFHEAARRICIFRNFLIKDHQDLIATHFLEENESRSVLFS